MTPICKNIVLFSSERVDAWGYNVRAEGVRD